MTSLFLILPAESICERYFSVHDGISRFFATDSLVALRIEGIHMSRHGLSSSAMYQNLDCSRGCVKAGLVHARKEWVSTDNTVLIRAVEAGGSRAVVEAGRLC